MHDLVSTEWLAGALGAPDLTVFDATKYLPNEPFDGLTKYREAHIQSARFFDIDVVADPDTNLPHMAPTAGRFARLMGEMGISNATRVIFYDQKGLQSSARGWWLMKLFGHEKAAVLDGGLPKWLAEGRATESGDAKPAAPSNYTPDFRADLVKGIGDVKRIVAHGGALILDARAKGRFDGTASEPRPGLPSGHMPGAQSVPFNELLNADFTMKDAAALRARFAAAGADGAKPIVTSCGTGVTACILALGLKQAGLGDAAIYDGSWTEWAGRPETQKEKSS
ncbi:MAG: rhodanese-like domain-containing protein [Acetobacteraceae bacterium]|jgi:thiosulfate/3-mercaptopyruvate sulfurtransferase|nr:rhodanese-like domain-containing protein [Acetobacteraceae bacterium]